MQEAEQNGALSQTEIDWMAKYEDRLSPQAEIDGVMRFDELFRRGVAARSYLSGRLQSSNNAMSQQGLSLDS